jgi:hypothetical protein
MTDAALRHDATPDTVRKAALDKSLIKLIRQILQGDGVVEVCDGGEIRVGAARRIYGATVLARAASLGLVTRSKDRLEATAEARSFLRRALVSGDEAYADQHRDMVKATVELAGVRQAVNRNLNESPLAGLGRLKDRNGEPFFPAQALDAGDRLLADFTRAQLQPRVTSSWEPRLSARAKGEAGGMAEIAATAVEARRRFGRAMDAMGPELSGVAADICCFGKGLELVERERQWPVRSAKLMLRTALLALSRHYAPPVREGRHRIHHWGSEGFRPDAGSYGSSGT